MYEFNTHQHNFASWAAARAVQRGWKGAKNSTLLKAINSSSMRSFLKNEKANDISEAEFERLHRKWCGELRASLREQGLEKKSISYGRLAKLVAVYLKSIVVLGPQYKTKLAYVIHPPIDRILLNSLWRYEKLSFVKNIAWTKCEEAEYFALIKHLRGWLDSSKPFWTLEEYWTID